MRVILHHGIIAAFLLTALPVTTPVTGSPADDIYAAFIKGDMNEWKKVIDSLYGRGDATGENTMELLNYEYGYVAWCIGNGRKDIARKYIARGQEHIDLLGKEGFRPSLVKAYSAAFFGFRIALNKTAAPVLGPKSLDCAKDALKLDPGSYFACLQYANALFYMPGIFGGSKEKALTFYLKALELMERDQDTMKGNWNYVNLLITISRAYGETGQKEMAERYIDRIIEFEPGCRWIRKSIYPSVMKDAD